LVAGTALAGVNGAQADDIQALNSNFNTANGIAINAQGIFIAGVALGGAASTYEIGNTSGTTIFTAGAGAANAISSDGQVAVGHFLTAGEQHAFIWVVQPGSFHDLGTLGGATSVANAVNSDGTVIVGQSDILLGPVAHAFRWTQAGSMVDIGNFNGIDLLTASAATGVSADGTVVVGWSALTPGPSTSVPHVAFRWELGGPGAPSNGGGTMTALGSLGGFDSEANGVSADGNVVVGWSTTSVGTDKHAFRWVHDGGPYGGGTMRDIGSLGAGDSIAYAVNANGSVVVGQSANQAFRWTTIDGMKSIQALLTAANVNMSGWTLTDAKGVSVDGGIIVGNGTHGGANAVWLARIALPDAGGSAPPAGGGNSNPPPTGFITMGTVAQSFAGQAALGQTGNAVIGGDLATFNQYATDAYASQRQRSTPYAVFAYGTYNSDPVAAGTLGITANLPDAMIVGGGINGDYVRTNNMVFGGNATMAGGSGGVFLARIPDAGLQWFVGVDGTALTGDVTRGYLNGSSPVSSHGNTDAVGYGATARIGWTFEDVIVRTQITPFAAYTYTNQHVNGYTETVVRSRRRWMASTRANRLRGSALTRATHLHPANGYGARPRGATAWTAAVGRTSAAR
jgi:probable HAF family extracellular repeat protein